MLTGAKPSTCPFPDRSSLSAPSGALSQLSYRPGGTVEGTAGQVSDLRDRNRSGVANRLLPRALELAQRDVIDPVRVDLGSRSVVGVKPLEQLLRGEDRARRGSRLDPRRLIHRVTERG